jgi:hypothetical protein
MAKRRPKTKRKIDPLRVSLRLLAIADRDTARAVRLLCKALLEPVQQPVFKVCNFKIGKEKYRRRLTSEHCKAIMKVVHQNGNVEAAVSGILGKESHQVADCIGSLMLALESSSGPVKQSVTLGCCMFDGGGPIPYLSQAQCNQYNPTKWDPTKPDCTHGP